MEEIDLKVLGWIRGVLEFDLLMVERKKICCRLLISKKKKKILSNK
jgi:hypothetical protein